MKGCVVKCNVIFHLNDVYLLSLADGCIFMWSMTCICCWFGAKIWKRAPLRLKWYMVLQRETHYYSFYFIGYLILINQLAVKIFLSSGAELNLVT